MRRKLYSSRNDSRVVLIYTTHTEQEIKRAQMSVEHTPSQRLIRIRNLVSKYELQLSAN